MDLYQVIKSIYPKLEHGRDFLLKNDGDERGTYILEWNIDLPQPTNEEMSALWVEVELDSARKLKIKELNQACNLAILGKFSCEIDGVLYYFSNDMEAQANFEKCDRAFEKGRITEETWTAYDVDGNVVRIVLTPETFETVYVAHLTHIRNNISKFRDFLMPLAENATKEELDSITWNTETQPEFDTR